MTAVARALAHLAATLDDIGCRWALVGGLAVSCHVDPRFTRDIDVAIAAAHDAEAEALVRALSSRSYRVVTAIEQDAVARLATVRLIGSPRSSADVVVDLLFASCGIEPELCTAASTIEALPGVRIPVATRAHLVAMKLLSVDDDRLQDALDLRSLLAGASAEDVDAIRRAVSLIEQRGFHRGRDLRASLRRYQVPR